jgi:hypothetical protein
MRKSARDHVLTPAAGPARSIPLFFSSGVGGRKGEVGEVGAILCALFPPPTFLFFSAPAPPPLAEAGACGRRKRSSLAPAGFLNARWFGSGVRLVCFGGADARWLRPALPLLPAGAGHENVLHDVPPPQPCVVKVRGLLASDTAPSDVFCGCIRRVEPPLSCSSTKLAGIVPWPSSPLL